MSDRQIVSGRSRRHFYYVGKDEVDIKRDNLTLASTLPGTRKLHQILPGPTTNSVKYRSYSCYCASTDECPHANNGWKFHTLKSNYIT